MKITCIWFWIRQKKNVRRRKTNCRFNTTNDYSFQLIFGFQKFMHIYCIPCRTPLYIITQTDKKLENITFFCLNMIRGRLKFSVVFVTKMTCYLSPIFKFCRQMMIKMLFIFNFFKIFSRLNDSFYTTRFSFVRASVIWITCQTLRKCIINIW